MGFTKIAWFHHDDISNFTNHPSNGAGVFTNGGSMANLTVLLSARAAAAPKAWSEGTPDDLVVIGSELWHYSISRAMSIMGMGTHSFYTADVDELGVMTMAGLHNAYERAIQDKKRVMCVVANACTTATGLYDPVDQIADFCNEKGIWFHVDAAHGAGALLSAQYKHLLQGVEKADSMIWDMHKMLRTSTLCAAVLFKNPEHKHATFNQKGSYLFHEKEQLGFDQLPYTLECTKLALGTKLFWVLAAEGEAGLTKYIDHLYGITKEINNLIKAHPKFESPYDPEANILCFRFLGDGDLDELQLKIRNKIVMDGKFYITSCDLNTSKYLRLTVMNDLTTLDHISNLLSEIEELAENM